jgi:hypothetical protein
MKTPLGWVYVVTHANAKDLLKIGITRSPANRRVKKWKYKVHPLSVATETNRNLLSSYA